MTPKNINYRKKTATLELEYEDRSKIELSAEYLRVFSPSAEVRGHHPSQATLQTGKQHVQITKIDPAGNYAIQIHFDDGHNSGIYSWGYLAELDKYREQNWQHYLDQLAEQRAFRDPNQQVVSLVDPKKSP